MGGVGNKMNNKIKKQTSKRLLIIDGHLKKVIRMVEEEAYCPDIIHQSQAVQAALKKVDEIILRGHLETCVLDKISSPPAKKKKLIEEIVSVFRKSEKNGKRH